jgi:hypothetical protein
MNKRPIVVLKTPIPYNVVNRFADEIAAGFEQLGHPVIVLDSRSGKFGLELNHAFSAHPMIAIGFNTAGLDFQLMNQPLYAQLDCHYISPFVDHPYQFIHRLMGQKWAYGVTLIDEGHLKDLAEFAHPHMNALFLPHGGSKAPVKWEGARDISILFSGILHHPDALVESWKDRYSKFRVKLLDAVDAGLAMSSVERNYSVLLQNVGLGKLKAKDYVTWALLYLQIERYFREHERLEVIQFLDDEGISVDIWGIGWEQCQFKHHRLHAPVNYDEILNLMSRTQTVLNISPMYVNGSHERVFSGLMNGARVISSYSHYLYGVSKTARGLQFYEAEALNSLTKLLKEPFDTLSAQESDFWASHHSWSNRAKLLLAWVDQLREVPGATDSH